MEINKIEEPALETNTECSKIPKTIDFIYYNFIYIYFIEKNIKNISEIEEPTPNTRKFHIL